MIKVHSRSNVNENVTEKLREDIILKKYSPEDRLVESELAKKYNVSRGSIRVAIQELIYEGLIGKNNKEKRIILFTNKVIKNMYELRLWLEMKAVKILIESDVIKYAPLIQVLSELEHEEKNMEIRYYCALDIEFHRKLLQASNNQAILQAWETMSSVFFTLLRVNTTKEYKKRYVNEFFAKHKKILDLLIIRDKACLKEIATHIEDAKNITLSVINE